VLDAAARGRDVTAVSYDNAVATHGSVVPDLLRALAIPPDLIDAGQALQTRRHVRDDWRVIELCRLFNGILADRWRMPQDDRCRSLAEHRGCTFFDLAPKIAALDPAVQGTFSAIVMRRRVTRVPEVPADTVLDDMTATYGHRFANPIDGRIFARPMGTPLTTTDLVWQEFRELAGRLASDVAAAWEREDATFGRLARAGRA
jgi:hypothetical protein